LDSLRQAALAHFGIAYLPKALVYDDILAENLVSLLADKSGKDLGIYAVYPRTRQPDKKIKLLIDYFREAFQNKKDYFY
jgi:DNA-binding transcriptional LysR family regulator